MCSSQLYHHVFVSTLRANKNRMQVANRIQESIHFKEWDLLECDVLQFGILSSLFWWVCSLRFKASRKLVTIYQTTRCHDSQYRRTPNNENPVSISDNVQLLLYIDKMQAVWWNKARHLRASLKQLIHYIYWVYTTSYDHRRKLWFDVCVTVHHWYSNINSQTDATITYFIDNYSQLNMFRAIISPILRSTRLCLQLAV